MSEVRVDVNMYLDANDTYTDEDGVERFGVYKPGVRDPESHRIRFMEGDTIRADAPMVDASYDEAGKQVTVTKSEEVHPSAAQTAADTNPSQSSDDNDDSADENAS